MSDAGGDPRRAGTGRAPGSRRESGRAEPERVLFVTDVYPPDCGGSGWSAHALALALREAGIALEVMEVDTRGTGSAQREFEGIEVEVLGVGAARRDPRRRLGARDFSFAAVESAVADRLTRTPRIDVVHGQHLHSGPPAAAAARQAGVPGVITLRDHWPVCLHGTHWWGGRDCPGCSRHDLVGCMREYLGFPTPLGHVMVPWARRRLAARRRGVTGADRVVAVSDTLRARVGARMEAATMDVIPNLVDPARSRRAAEGASRRLPGGLPEEFLLVAGKINAAKGFGGLLQALADSSVRWPLVVAGTGPLRDEMEVRARQLDLDVRFLGWVEHRELMGLIARARAVLLPSLLEEALSRIILESMALGTPVIAWSTGSAREVIEDGANGWIVDGAADLESALAALTEEAVARAVGRAALETARSRFSPEAVVPRYLSLYGEAMDAAG